jgi:signal transduction histidine kinase
VNPRPSTVPSGVKLRWHLAVLVLASVVPLVVFSAIVAGRLQREERARFEQELVQVTRAITVTIDHELLGATRALQAFAGSALLDDGHLSTFPVRARELLAAHPAWRDVVVIEPRGFTPVMSLASPAGGAPIPAEESDAVREVIAQRRPMISDGFVERVSARLVVALLVPVERAGQLEYVLGAHYEPATLMTLVTEHAIPHLWAVGIVDRRNLTIARSRGGEFVGKPANPSFVKLAPASGVAAIQLPTLEGVPAHGGIARSPLTGWLIGASRSGHPIEASLQRSGWALAGVGLAFLVVGLALAAFLASRITRPMVALSASTTALTGGGLEMLSRSGVTEVARLARAVVDAEREREALLRREAHAETEKLRAELAHVGRVSVMGELSASLAHELKQPLTAIVANALALRRMVVRADPNHPEILAALDDIAGEGRRAAEVIRRLRALFRHEPSERRLLDLNELIAGVATLVRGEVERHRVTLTLELEPSLPAVQGDAIQLQQVVLNLLMNACEALGAADDSPRQLTVTTASPEPALVKLSVRDTGIGIKDQEAERMFAPFVTSKPEGLGMGLAISRSIVEAHGGHIWALRNDDRGITIHVVIPVASESPLTRVGVVALRSSP